jgi:hypothetical protein
MSVWSIGMVKWEINKRIELGGLYRPGRSVVGDNGKASEGRIQAHPETTNGLQRN